MRSLGTSTCLTFEVLGKMSEMEANGREAEEERDSDTESDSDDSEFSDPEGYVDDISDEGTWTH